MTADGDISPDRIAAFDQAAAKTDAIVDQLIATFRTTRIGKSYEATILSAAMGIQEMVDRGGAGVVTDALVMAIARLAAESEGVTQ
jgi:hypothetical protein